MAQPRKSRKPFPVMQFQDVLAIAKTISEVGVDDKLRRLILFDRLGKSPTSGSSRQLISSSSRYGLTSGGYQAELIILTDAGKIVAGQPISIPNVRNIVFKCAIMQFDSFNQLYDKLKNHRVPSEDVLHDEFRQIGLGPTDCGIATDVFIANARYVGLIQEVSGSEWIIPIEQVIEGTGENANGGGVEAPDIPVNETPSKQEIAMPVTSPAINEPSVHIDIQIHIDSTATTEQIDQIFASMSKHLYRREG